MAKKKCKHQWKRIATSIYGVICEKCGKQVEDMRLLKNKKDLIEETDHAENDYIREQKKNIELQKKLDLEIEINKRLMKYIKEFRD